jgi:di/tricarboxylate transporter
MLVFSSGGYRFGDFCRIGAPLDALLWIAGSLLIPLLWPLQ